MYTRNKIALMIENKLGYTNGWKVDDETYERECLMIADEIIQLFSIPVVVGQSEQLKPKPQICYKSNELCKYDCSGLCKESC